MNGSLLKFYVHENQLHHGHVLWEWLLSHAREIGIRGGSAFKGTGGFARAHTLAQHHPLELTGSQTVEIEFLVSDQEADRLLDWVREQKIQTFYSSSPARFGLSDAVEPSPGVLPGDP